MESRSDQTSPVRVTGGRVQSASVILTGGLVMAVWKYASVMLLLLCAGSTSSSSSLETCRSHLDDDPRPESCVFDTRSCRFSTGLEIRFHYFGIVREDNRTWICVGFRTATTSVVTLRMRTEVVTGVVSVDTECWRRKGWRRPCDAVFLPVPGVLDTFLHSPLERSFWSDFRDEQLFHVDWIWSVDVRLGGGEDVIPASWVSLLNVSSLKELHVGGNVWRHPQNLLGTMPRLEKLDLSDNAIDVLAHDWLEGTPHLRHLNLSNNSLQEFPDGLSQLTSLDMSSSGTIHVSDQQVATLDKVSRLNFGLTKLETNLSLLLKLPGLVHLNLSGSLVRDIPEDLQESSHPTTLSVLDLSFNRLVSLPVKVFSSVGGLNHLHLQGNLLSICPQECLNRLPQLRLLDLSGNGFASLLSTCFLSVRQLRHLDLSHNRITWLHNDIFQHLSSLVHLNLAHNHLYSLNVVQLGILESLAVLDLSFNSLTQDPVMGRDRLLLYDLSNNNLTHVIRTTEVKYIRTLDLSGNNIREMRLFRVGHLNLSRNRLQTIDYNMISQFGTVEFTIDLGGNAFACCDNRLGEWFRKKPIPVLNLRTWEPIKCRLQTSEVDVTREDVCRAASLEVWVSVGVLGLLLVGVAVVLYVNRFELTYIGHLLHMRRARMQTDDQRYGTCVYDAFICYSDRNFQWVVKQLLPELEEGPERYRLCLHNRDFPLGSAIDRNIVEAIENSRKVVIVLTKDFISSKWCQWELEMANHKTLVSNRGYIILVELERLDRRSLPKHLRYLMATRTYLEWRGDERSWKRLREALGVSIWQKSQCACGVRT